MSDKEILQFPGDYAIDEALIVGSSGVPINITRLIQEINIFENIETPYMSGSIIITDAAGVAEAMPFLGQERLIFSLRTPGGNKISFLEYHAIIYNVGFRLQGSERSQNILLNFTTLENYRNFRTRVSKSFKGNISDIVRKILLGKNYLNSKKPLDLEETRDIRKFVIPNISPFDAIILLSTEAISKERNSPHYLFYENNYGFHFHTLDSLLGKGTSAVKHKAVYRYEAPPPGNVSVDPYTLLPTILNWDIANNSNSIFNVRSGAYASTLFTHDIFNKNIQKFEFDYIKDSFNKRNSTNQHRKGYGTVVPQQKLEDKTVTEYTSSKIFVHPSATNLHSTGIHNNSEKWLQEGRSRGLSRKFFTLRIETYGNTNVTVGDLINVQIPSNRPLSTAEAKDSGDRTLSGRYLITELHHLVVPSTQSHSMVMRVMKDSFENEMPVGEVQYKSEPRGMVNNPDPELLAP